MKALSIRQPWPWLIVRPDLTDPFERAEARMQDLVKEIENRTWATTYRGQLLVHASKTFDREGWEWVRVEFPEIPMPPQGAFSMGGIVGRAQLTECVTESNSPWFVGPYGFVLEGSVPMEFTPARGQLGIFEMRVEAFT